MRADEAARLLGRRLEYGRPDSCGVVRPNELGSGAFATCWALEGGTEVLKYTRGTRDVAAYRRVMRLQTRGLCRAFATVLAELKDEVGPPGMGGCTCEACRTERGSGYWFVQERVPNTAEGSYGAKLVNVPRDLYIDRPPTGEADEAAVRKSVVEAGWSKLGDLHHQNVGRRANGEPVVFDLGFPRGDLSLPTGPRWLRLKSALARVLHRNDRFDSVNPVLAV